MRRVTCRIDAVQAYLHELFMRLRLVGDGKELDVRVLTVILRLRYPVAVVKQCICISHCVWHEVSDILGE